MVYRTVRNCRREVAQRDMDRRMVAQLCNSIDRLDNVRVLVIAATSRPEYIDPSVRRTGRFDREVHTPFPDRSARREILGTLTRKLPMEAVLSRYKRLDTSGRTWLRKSQKLL